MILLLLCIQDDIPKLKATLKDASYGNLWDRRDAARDLGKMGTREAADALLEFAGVVDPATREAIVLALAGLKDDAVRAHVLEALPRLRDEKARADVIWAFRRMKWGADGVARMLRDGSPLVRAEAARTLGALGDARCAEAVDDKDPAVVEQALLAAAEVKVKVDAKFLKASNPRVQAAAVRATPEADVTPLLKGRPEVRIAVADIAASIDPLRTLIHDDDWRVRVAAVAGCERLWVIESIDVLIERLPKEDGRLQLDIVLALQRLTGKAIGYDGKDWKAWWDAQRGSFKMPDKPKAGRAIEKDAGETKVSFFGIPLYSKRVVFVIDCSGSMKNEDELYKGKRKIDVALEELKKAVGGLAKDAKFNVIMLSTEATAQKVRSLSPKLVPASPQNCVKAVELVNNAWKKLEDIKRGRGDLYDAVAEGWADPETDTVILLSDGKSTDGKYIDRDHLIEAFGLDHRDRRVCIHAVLTGSTGIDEKAMQAFAEVTGGIYMPRK